MTSSLRDLIAGAIAEVLSGSPDNRMDDFGGQPVFVPPLVGMADGDDPVFEALKTAVSQRHLMPREILRAYSAAGGEPAGVSVVSWALPFTKEIRLSNRNREWPSELYSVARNNGGALLHEIGRRLPGILSERGIASVVPAETPKYDAFRDAERTFSSTWSERHVAYAAGLGRFGLNGALITADGSNARLGSIVTNRPPEDALPERGDHRAPCLKSGGRVCGLCVAKCPALAIGGEGLDKSRCNDRRKAIREKSLDAYLRTYHLTASRVVKSGRRDPGYSLGCAVCQAGVPCEDRDPFQGKRE
jgi:epoxyqueuosine reductase QueG